MAAERWRADEGVSTSCEKNNLLNRVRSGELLTSRFRRVKPTLQAGAGTKGNIQNCISTVLYMHLEPVLNRR